MPKLPSFSSKRLQIQSANATMVMVTGIAAFVVVFSLMASRALLGQSAYQARVIKEKKVALKQLKENIQNADELRTAYAAFANEPENVIGGNPKGTGPRDGDNPRIVLDALPSKYDYPALASSLEKLLKDGGYHIDGISGVDDEINQLNKESPNPAPVDMPFPMNVSGSYDSMQKLVGLLEKSIRPIHIQTINFTGSDGSMKMSVSATTYYQPEKSLTIKTKVVK